MGDLSPSHIYFLHERDVRDDVKRAKRWPPLLNSFIHEHPISTTKGGTSIIHRPASTSSESYLSPTSAFAGTERFNTCASVYLPTTPLKRLSPLPLKVTSPKRSPKSVKKMIKADTQQIPMSPYKLWLVEQARRALIQQAYRTNKNIHRMPLHPAAAKTSPKKGISSAWADG
jgi:hypothetical protein